MKLDSGSVSAAVFTQNAFCAAPVIVAREHLSQEQPVCLLINTGNANAGTGEAGIHDARLCCEHVAKQAGCVPQAVLPFSTGVIGESCRLKRYWQASRMHWRNWMNKVGLLLQPAY